MLLIKKDHPLALKESITPQDLIDVPLLCSSQELKYKQIENWANSYFSKYHIIATYNLIYNASILTKECNGAVISLKNLIDTSSENSLCFRPLEPQITSSLAFIWKKYRVLSKTAHYFLKVLEEEIKKAHKCPQINKNMIK